MENLKKKTFYTIFIIISSLAFIFAILFNVQTYKREYQEILNNLTRMQNLTDNKFQLFEQNKKTTNEEEIRNRKIMDYEVYTFILDNTNNIIDQISHSDNENINNDVLNEANNILTKNKESNLKIGILYFTNYAYNLNNYDSLTIINTMNTKNILLTSLLISILLILIGEIIIYLIAKKLTEWITKPVLESFEREKEFVANASHELKTPLAVMMASIDSLKVNKNNEKWINILKNESDRMNDLITRLLDLAKSENLISKENFTEKDLSKIVEKRALIFEALAFDKNVTIKTNIKEKINFMCHEGSIDELISILIDNAISHSSENSEITINLSKIKSEIKLEVINKGDAISNDDCEKIFERFYRCDESHNRKSNRYGLGLAIAKNIVASHNGKISAFSKDGYTTFKVIFNINKKS